MFGPWRQIFCTAPTPDSDKTIEGFLNSKNLAIPLRNLRKFRSCSKCVYNLESIKPNDSINKFAMFYLHNQSVGRLTYANPRESGLDVTPIEQRQTVRRLAAGPAIFKTRVFASLCQSQQKHIRSDSLQLARNFYS